MLLSCLAFCSVSLNLALAPIVKSSVLQLLLSIIAYGFVIAKASGVCPKGYFRNVTVLFPCDKNSGASEICG